MDSARVEGLLVDFVDVEAQVVRRVQLVRPGFGHGLQAGTDFTCVYCLRVLWFIELFKQMFDPIIFSIGIVVSLLAFKRAFT